MIEPIVAVVAELDPLIAANIPQAPIDAMPRPPRTQPNSASAKSDIRLAIPPLAIRSPVRMNSGAANNAKLFNPSNIELPMLASGKSKISCMPTTHRPITSSSGVPVKKKKMAAIDNPHINSSFDMFRPF